MPTEKNMAAQERMAQAVNNGNLDVLSEVFAPNVVDHDPAPDQQPGPEGFKHFFATLRSAFPDLTVKPEHMVTNEDEIALAYTISGTHKGDLPSGCSHRQAHQCAWHADCPLRERPDR